MNRILTLTGLALAAATLSTPAQLFFSDDFDYADGGLTNVSGGLWAWHSGTPGTALVSGGRLEIDQNRSEDVNRQFENYGAVTYVSLIANFSELPTAAGTYFTHLMNRTNTFQFSSRVYAQAGSASVPGTFRLGVSGAASTPNKVYPLDLVPNVDYRVVFAYDTVNLYATLWINPVSEWERSVATSDAVTNTVTIDALAFRQSTGEGVLKVDNVRVGASFTDVVSATATLPTIAVAPDGFSVFAGADGRLNVAAYAQGQVSFSWLRNGQPVFDSGVVSGSSSNVLSFVGISGAEAGNYQAVVTSPAGSVTSVVAVVSVNTSQVAPTFSVQPQSQTNYVGASITFTATATGTEPITYTWYKQGDAAYSFTGRTNAISGLASANAGFYYVVAQNAIGARTSTVARLEVLPPVVTNIAHLRTLLDTTTWLPTNTVTAWQIEGVVITHTNVGAVGNAQFYIQDATAGIDVFMSGSTTIRPKAGDWVRAVGQLGSFNSLLELNLAAANAGHSITILSNNAPMPLATSLHDFALGTNNPAAMEMLEGSLVTLTNVWLTGGAGNWASGTTRATNAAGQTFDVFVDSRMTHIIGTPRPAFARQVTGALGQFLSQTAPQRNYGYQIILTRPQDVVAAAPPAPAIAISRSGDRIALSWPNSPGSTYSVWTAPDIAGPFTRAVFGVNSLGEALSFTDAAAGPVRFYRVSNP